MDEKTDFHSGSQVKTEVQDDGEDHFVHNDTKDIVIETSSSSSISPAPDNQLQLNSMSQTQPNTRKQFGFLNYDAASKYYRECGLVLDESDHGFETWSYPARVSAGPHDLHDLLVHHYKGGSFSLLYPKVLAFEDGRPVFVISIGKHSNHTVKVRVKPAIQLDGGSYAPSQLVAHEANAGRLTNNHKDLIKIDDFPSFATDLASLPPKKKSKDQLQVPKEEKSSHNLRQLTPVDYALLSVGGTVFGDEGDDYSPSLATKAKKATANHAKSAVNELAPVLQQVVHDLEEIHKDLKTTRHDDDVHGLAQKKVKSSHGEVTASNRHANIQILDEMELEVIHHMKMQQYCGNLS
jgi:hypothetical protein